MSHSVQASNIRVTSRIQGLDRGLFVASYFSITVDTWSMGRRLAMDFHFHIHTDPSGAWCASFVSTASEMSARNIQFAQPLKPGSTGCLYGLSGSETFENMLGDIDILRLGWDCRKQERGGHRCWFTTCTQNISVVSSTRLMDRITMSTRCLGRSYTYRRYRGFKVTG